MPSLFLKILVPTAALATFVVGTTIAWSNNVSLKGDRVTRNPVTRSVAAVPDYDAAFASRSRKADREVVARAPATVTPVTVTPVAVAPVKVDFSQAFADATATPRHNNTPAKREKLRNAGWALINGSR
jgi:hypothetical protein